MSDLKNVVREGVEIQIECPEFRYDLGLEHVLDQGYERLPNLSEIIGITIDILRGNNDERLVRMTTTEPRAYGWLNLAWEIQKKTLIAYVKPTGLRWEERTDPVTKRISANYWRTSAFGYEQKVEFPLPLSSSAKTPGDNRRYYLPDFSPEFILFHMGMPLQDLPPEMKRNDGVIIDLPWENVVVDVPWENALVPVSYARLWGLPTELSAFGDLGAYGGARGVRKIKSNSNN